jgi:hypothetical protein
LKKPFQNNSKTLTSNYIYAKGDWGTNLELATFEKVSKKRMVLAGPVSARKSCWAVPPHEG